MEKKERSIAIVGSGPRGMSVLERLAARLSQNKENEIETDIYLIDNGFVGTGRVWSIKQSPYLLMNTIAQEISAFSGPWDGKEDMALELIMENICYMYWMQLKNHFRRM